MKILLLFSLLLPVAPASAQTSAPGISVQSAAQSEALRVLSEVSQKYADAKSYHIEATEETVFSNELSRNWQKFILSVSVAPDDKYHYEGRGPMGSAVRVSDGKTIWTLHVTEQLYTQKQAGADKGGPRLMETGEEGVQRAETLRAQLAHVADHLKSAELLPEEKIAANGLPRLCILVHYKPEDLKAENPQRERLQEEGTIWIDKERMVILKRTRKMQTFIKHPGSSARTALEEEMTTLFPVVELSVPVPDPVFTFAPPPEARLVDEFPAQKEFSKRMATEVQARNELLGKLAPEVELQSAEGKTVPLSRFRGKPLLIDVWATWCSPCIHMIPELKKLQEDLSGLGVELLSVDVDEDPSIAATYLAREQVSWQNLHDPGDRMRKAFHATGGIPWQVLLDAEGKVAYYQIGENIAALRVVIAKLGPQYSSISNSADEKHH